MIPIVCLHGWPKVLIVHVHGFWHLYCSACSGYETDRKKRTGRAGDSRVPGYDLARGLAVLVMVVLNVTGVLASVQASTGWLELALGFLDRRAAAALMIISGAGISLYARAGWTAQRQRALVRRGIFLVAAGLMLSLIWSGDILHIYGVLICMGAMLARTSIGCWLGRAWAALPLAACAGPRCWMYWKMKAP